MTRTVLRAAWLIAVALTAAATAGGCLAYRGYDDDDDDYECDYRPANPDKPAVLK